MEVKLTKSISIHRKKAIATTVKINKLLRSNTTECLKKFIKESKLNIELFSDEGNNTHIKIINEECDVSLNKMIEQFAILDTIVKIAIDNEHAIIMQSLTNERLDSLNKDINGMYGKNEKPTESKTENEVPNGN